MENYYESVGDQGASGGFKTHNRTTNISRSSGKYENQNLPEKDSDAYYYSTIDDSETTRVQKVHLRQKNAYNPNAKYENVNQMLNGSGKSQCNSERRWKIATGVLSVFVVIFLVLAAYFANQVFTSKEVEKQGSVRLENTEEIQNDTVNYCANANCLNNGTCINLNDTHACLCQDGYYGKDCQVTPCSSQPCLNDGKCHVSGSSYTCECKRGFSGSNCEVTPCSNQPCLNDGKCHVSGSSYTCECKSGFSGSNCEVTPCSSQPCLNNGQCHVSGSSYYCGCKSGYSGRTCQVTPCSSSPCLNKGCCKPTGSGYQCSCPEGYSGSRCEQTPRGGTCFMVNGKCDRRCYSGYVGNQCQDSCPSGWFLYKNKCFYFSSHQRNWNSAKSYCITSMNGKLAEPRSSSEIYFLSSTAKSKGNTYWIGGTDRSREGKWYWASGGYISYFAWHTRTIVEPNDQGGNEDCISISKGLSYEWNDDRCYNSYRFICQKSLS